MGAGHAANSYATWGGFGEMIGGYTAFAQTLFISYLKDMLRPHNIHKFSIGLNKHTVHGKYTYYHQRNRINRIEAEKFFTERNKDFQMWCNLMNWDPIVVLQIVKDCVEKDQDRLYGKRALRAYFKSAEGAEND